MPKILTPENFLRGQVPSKNSFKKATAELKRGIRNIDEVVFASFLGSSVNRDISYASDIDIFIIYDGVPIFEAMLKAREKIRAISQLYCIPIEVHMIPLEFLKVGIFGCGGSFGCSIISASKRIHPVIKMGDNFDVAKLLQQKPEPISRFFASKHTSVIKQFLIMPDISVLETGLLLDSQQRFLQKLLQIPYHTIRNVLFYSGKTSCLGGTREDTRAQWENAFGFALIEEYQGLFDIEYDYLITVDSFIKNNEFDLAIYSNVIENIWKNVFNYVNFVEKATRLIFPKKPLI